MNAIRQTDFGIAEAEPERLDAMNAFLRSRDLGPVSDACFAQSTFWRADDADGIVGVIGMERHKTVGLWRSFAVREDVQRGMGGYAPAACLLRAALAGFDRETLRTAYMLTDEKSKAWIGRGFRRADVGALPEALTARMGARTGREINALLLHLPASGVPTYRKFLDRLATRARRRAASGADGGT